MEEKELTNKQLNELIDYLETACDFREDEEKGYVWNCQGYDHTRKWLVEHGVDNETVLRQLLHLGGGCDCEIVFNIPPKIEFVDYRTGIRRRA